MDLNRVELDTISRVGVQPVNRRTVFVGKPLRNPHHHAPIQPSRVGQQLAKVLVVGRLQLVLDKHSPTFVVSADDVGTIRPDAVFGALDLKRKPEGILKDLEVLWAG